MQVLQQFEIRHCIAMPGRFEEEKYVQVLVNHLRRVWPAMFVSLHQYTRKLPSKDPCTHLIKNSESVRNSDV
jgi:hypothetical protein